MPLLCLSALVAQNTYLKKRFEDTYFLFWAWAKKKAEPIMTLPFSWGLSEFLIYN